MGGEGDAILLLWSINGHPTPGTKDFLEAWANTLPLASAICDFLTQTFPWADPSSHLAGNPRPGRQGARLRGQAVGAGRAVPDTLRRISSRRWHLVALGGARGAPIVCCRAGRLDRVFSARCPRNKITIEENLLKGICCLSLVGFLCFGLRRLAPFTHCLPAWQSFRRHSLSQEGVLAHARGRPLRSCRRLGAVRLVELLLRVP